MYLKNPRINSGHQACAGCGATIAMNLASRHFPEKTVMVIPASCWSVIAGPYPYRTLNFPAVHSAFAAGSAMATGIHYALMSKKEKDFRVIVWAGDGGTFDIGLQSLSGALERNLPFTYICYDNEAYMNTGVQRSSATPLFTETTTTPSPNLKEQPKKDFLEIIAAHNVPYAASATIAFPEDLENKVKKAVSTDGPSVLHIFSPCPTGQGYAEKYSVKISRLAAESGVFPIYEFENNTYHIQNKPDFSKIDEYLAIQSRFKNIDEELKKMIKHYIEYKWNILTKKSELFH
ncbi:MAG TPA: pyruvate synthase subunit beta [Spirochaetia bacterium]|nr:MAG: 2-ketoisovalerate ferredoxin oxidoreductase [Spirochaetes bacterium GWB1_36_13]HCL57083.1 pyruvate synthase subunit beta [Spirochaetia bacterium]